MEQLRFTRAEVERAMRGTPDADAERRLVPMNSIGWIVGHLAWQEQRYWLTRAQGLTPVPLLDEVVPNGGPATTPALRQMRAARRAVMAAADPWLDALTTDDLMAELPPPGPRRTIGDALQRVIYHQWFHAGEIARDPPAARPSAPARVRRWPRGRGAIPSRRPVRRTARHET